LNDSWAPDQNGIYAKEDDVNAPYEARLPLEQAPNVKMDAHHGLQVAADVEIVHRPQHAAILHADDRQPDQILS
jgi:hypothetical protein